MITSVSRRLLPRILLALLLAFSSEVLVWAAPIERAPIDWVFAGLAYLGFGFVGVDLIVRWRVRDLYGAAALGGAYALAYAMFINPADTLLEVPRTLVTRVMGAHALVAQGIILLFFILLAKPRLRWLLLPLAALIGACWGTWVRYTPVLSDLTAHTITADALMLIGGVALAVVAALTFLQTRLGNVPRADLMLSDPEWVGVGVLALALLYRQAQSRSLSDPAYLIVMGLLLICLAMLWFRKDSRFAWVNADLTPTPPWTILLVAGLLFLGAASSAFEAPLIGTDLLNQYQAVVYLFILWGLIWLPGVALLLGLRGMLRGAQAGYD